jgi:hypothetical protein
MTDVLYLLHKHTWICRGLSWFIVVKLLFFLAPFSSNTRYQATPHSDTPPRRGTHLSGSSLGLLANWKNGTQISEIVEFWISTKILRKFLRVTLRGCLLRYVSWASVWTNVADSRSFHMTFSESVECRTSKGKSVSNGFGADTGVTDRWTDGHDVYTSRVFCCFVKKTQQFCTYVLWTCLNECCTDSLPCVKTPACSLYCRRQLQHCWRRLYAQHSN